MNLINIDLLVFKNYKMNEEIEPHIIRKLEILQKIGKGAYGIVWKAIERKSKHVVALKKVKS